MFAALMNEELHGWAGGLPHSSPSPSARCMGPAWAHAVTICYRFKCTMYHSLHIELHVTVNPYHERQVATGISHYDLLQSTSAAGAATKCCTVIGPMVQCMVLAFRATGSLPLVRGGGCGGTLISEEGRRHSRGFRSRMQNVEGTKWNIKQGRTSWCS